MKVIPWVLGCCLLAASACGSSTGGGTGGTSPTSGTASTSSSSSTTSGSSSGATCSTCESLLTESIAGNCQNPLPCAGTSATTYSAFDVCALGTCSASCSSCPPSTACLTCMMTPDTMGGCDTEYTACMADK